MLVAQKQNLSVMKKLFSIFAAVTVIAILFSACSPKTSTGMAVASRAKFTGNWTITNVSYDGLVEGAVQSVFDQAPPRAFVGSTWRLTNSGNGIYTLTSGASQTIYWSVNNSGTDQQFQFKKIYQGDKAKNVETGYQLLVQSNNGSTMVLRTPIRIGSTNGYVVYTFAKS